MIRASALCLAAILFQPAAFSDEGAAPALAGGGDFHPRKPEMYRAGWVDLNKNGSKDVYEDPDQPVEARMGDLVRRMTLGEKVGQLSQRHMQEDSAGSDARLLAAGGLGSYLGAAPEPALRNRLQRIAVEESRLGIPLIFGFDTIHGFRTIFPIPLALSCAWDPALVERVDAAAAAESAAAGVDWVFAPMVDVARDPRWGRIAEGAGEDPWLGARIAAAAVRGFEGGGQAGVVACLKHYVGYGAAEGGRDYNSTEIGLPTLRNIYLPPFKAGVEAGAGTVMSAFNCLNGIPASGNRFTLTEILRDQWDFRGFVVSDWNAVGELVDHGYAPDAAAAAALALDAGVDMEMVGDCYGKYLPSLVGRRKVAEAQVDAAVMRILRVKLAKGLFERPYAAPVRTDAAANRALAREAVARSCVLLKNEGGLLPLGLRSGTVALIGPFSDDPADMLGCWSGLGRAGDVVTPASGLAAALPGVRLEIVRGCDATDASERDAAAAVAAASQADVVILALGEPARMSGENRFRSDLGLPGLQQDLFNRIAALGRPIITVLFSGRPLALREVLDRSGAVLLAWHPGVQAGPGIADVLTGAVDPSGRLTTSFPRTSGGLPVYYNHLHTGRPMADYAEGPREALLPFGFGLTYGRFEYGPTLVSATGARGDALVVAATVSNAGPRAGTEVVQLYLHALSSRAGVRPVRELKGFQRITLPPGGRRDVLFTLARSDLGCWSADGEWVVEPGRYEFVVAPDSSAGRMTAFTLE